MVFTKTVLAILVFLNGGVTTVRFNYIDSDNMKNCEYFVEQITNQDRFIKGYCAYVVKE